MTFRPPPDTDTSNLRHLSGAELRRVFYRRPDEQRRAGEIAPEKCELGEHFMMQSRPCVSQSRTEARPIMSIESNRREIAREAKAIVALAFRNGPIEDLHAGRPCPMCAGQDGFSRITDDEMKLLMKHAVDHVYHLLLLREEDPVEYETKIQFGERYTAKWDEPQIPKRRRHGLVP